MTGLILGPIDELPQAEYYTRELRGPIMNGVTYQPYTLTLYARFAEHPPRPNSCECPVWDIYLKVKSGRGILLYNVSNHALKSTFDTMRHLSDNALFTVFYLLSSAQDQALAIGKMHGADEYRRAFVDGKLKKRKQPSTGQYHVWIE